MLTESWWKPRRRDNVLIMFYEDMKKDLDGTAQQQIDDFCIRELDKLDSGFPYRDRYGMNA